MNLSDPPRFATARGLITDHLGRWLLLRDDRPHWYLPGGWIEPGERPRAACAREVFEETGLVAAPAELLVIGANDGSWSLIFDCGSVNSDGLALSDENNPETLPVREYRWAPSTEALHLLKPAIAERMTAWIAYMGRPGPVYVE